MPSFSGTVQAVSVKQMQAPDQYENTHRANLLIGDDWYSYGSIKRGVQGEVWTKTGMITKGAEVEGMFDQNGDFKNIKKATVTVLKVGQDNQSSPAGAASTTSAKAPQKKDSYIFGVAVGAAMNQASNIHSGKKPDFDAIEKTAIQMYLIAEDLKARAEAGDIESAVVEKSQAAEPAIRGNTANTVVTDNFDDDVPF